MLYLNMTKTRTKITLWYGLAIFL